jgi:metallo-beta-lactamase family protein
MEIQFLGGAREVTGSQHLLTVNGKKILLDCGLFQGRRSETYKRNLNFSFDPSELDVLILSHAHIDHSGNIPNLVKNGFTGKILATGATVDLCQIMLRDSAYIQEKDAFFVNKYKKRKNETLIEPLYKLEDAEKALLQFHGVEYGQSYEVVPGVKVKFRDAGHILGSASVLLEITEPGKNQPVRLGFTGDLGRSDVPVVKDPDYLRNLDVLLTESTYGDRLHKPTEDVEEELASLIRETASEGGKIIIPSFAVGRTQLLVYILHKLFNQARIPDLPVFVDSPLAVNATEIFRRHPDCLDRETHRIFIESEEDPFGFSRLQYIRDVNLSKKLNSINYPHIIISASGMAEAGRILHHLRNNIGNPANTVLLVGYSAQHTLARKLRDGEKIVKIFGEEHAVRCRVEAMDNFSAHGDKNDLLDFITTLPTDKLKKIFVVHGEETQSLAFQKTLVEKGYKDVVVPEPGVTYTF